MNFNTFWGLFFGVISLCQAQTITLSDQQTNRPLEGVLLLSSRPRATAVTNSRGQADISAFEGADIIEIRLLGYQTLQRSYEALQNLTGALHMEPANLQLDGVVVTASRWRQSIFDVPSKVALVTPEEVALQNPQTAADLLGISGKVFIQKSQQGGGSPMIRGFATNRLLYTVDGVRMNTAIFRSGNIQNVINLDPFATERTEVVFGPGSVIYGSDAIGGVMGFETLTPQFSLSDSTLVTGKGTARYASANNERTGHFDVNVGWKKWSMVTSFSAWDFDHLRQGSHGPDDYVKGNYVQRQDSSDVVIAQEEPLLQIPTAYSQINLMQKVRFRPSNQWDLTYAFHLSETSSYGRYDRHNRVRNGAAQYAEWDYGPQRWIMNQFTASHSRNSGLYDQATLRLAQQAFEESRISRNFNDPSREVRLEEVAAYSGNLDLVKKLGRHILYYGLEYVYNDVTSTGTDENMLLGTAMEGAARYPQSSWNSFALYLSDAYTFSDRFTLLGGLRYNRFGLEADFRDNLAFYPFPFEKADIQNGALTGSLGGVYHADNSLTIKASFGTAFRSPNVDDVGKVFDSEPGSVVVPNPDLGAEYAYSFDLGIAKILGKSVKVDVTGYYTLLQNALVRRDFVLNGQDSIPYDGSLSRVQAIQNAATANVYGIQAGVEVKLPAGFSFLTDLNFQKGEEELEDGTASASRHAPPFFGLSRLNFNTGRLTLQLYAIYQGERSHDDLAWEEQGKDEIYAKDQNGNTFAPSWYTLNLKSGYRFSESLRLNAGLENITDQRYRPYSSGISGAGRNFILSLTAYF